MTCSVAAYLANPCQRNRTPIRLQVVNDILNCPCPLRVGARLIASFIDWISAGLFQWSKFGPFPKTFSRPFDQTTDMFFFAKFEHLAEVPTGLGILFGKDLQAVS